MGASIQYTVIAVYVYAKSARYQVKTYLCFYLFLALCLIVYIHKLSLKHALALGLKRSCIGKFSILGPKTAKKPFPLDPRQLKIGFLGDFL